MNLDARARHERGWATRRAHCYLGRNERAMQTPGRRSVLLASVVGKRCKFTHPNREATATGEVASEGNRVTSSLHRYRADNLPYHQEKEGYGGACPPRGLAKPSGVGMKSLSWGFMRNLPTHRPCTYFRSIETPLDQPSTQRR